MIWNMKKKKSKTKEISKDLQPPLDLFGLIGL